MLMKDKLLNSLALAGSIALIVLVDIVGRYYGPDAWYDQLEKPWYNLPEWAYPFVWIPLYLINAVCAWWVWLSRNENKDVFGAMVFYLVQLILNMQWSNIFFGLHRIDLAFYEILFLVFFVVLTNIMFWKVNRKAGILYLPYTLFTAWQIWVNYAFWTLNP